MFHITHFPKAKKYWHMGKFHDWSEGIIHPMSHAFHYGSSTFEGIRAYNTAKGPAVFRLAEHIERFLHSASVVKMKSPYTKDEIIDAVKAVIKENALDCAYIRPLLFYSYGNLGLVPKFSPVELVIGAWEWGAYLGEKADKGVSVYLVPWRRIHFSQLDMSAKLGGVYVQSTICGLEAREQGCDEAVFLNMEGNIAEGPGENIFVVKGKTLKTNDRAESILEGITRQSILEIGKDLGYQTEIGPITTNDFFCADEAFFTGTAVEVVPIVHVIDASDPRKAREPHTIGTGKTGPVTADLRAAYLDVVAGRTEKFEKWLTYIH
ncbi:MAG: branched-chain amino acid transaminase [Acidobacteriota bacterium]|nr:branched-chain amino acid transaminase [Acidobacteriota bacterium]